MFITLEGIEGSGKSTLLNGLAEHLQALSRGVLKTREPGGVGLGKALRAMLLDPANQGLSSRAELFLYLADRAQHVDEIVRPALHENVVVLCDRFTDSTLAYQGYGRGLDLGELRRLNAMATGKTVPDLTLVLDLPVEVGLKRAFSRNVAQGTTASEGRFEAESLAFHDRVRRGYLALAALEPQRIKVLDATLNPESLREAAQVIVVAALTASSAPPAD